MQETNDDGDNSYHLLSPCEVPSTVQGSTLHDLSYTSQNSIGVGVLLSEFYSSVLK